MPQFANEYEGFGNALMNIGSMYYADSERKKEEKRRKQELLEAEERRRSEKLEDRKYEAEQAEIAYKRTAPLETLKLEAARLKAEREKAELTRPRTSGVGNTIIQQKPKFGEDGSFAGWEESRSVAAPRSSAPRSNAARTQVINGRVMQFNDATQAYDKNLGAAGSPRSTKSEDPIKKATGLMQSAAALREKASLAGDGNPLAVKYNEQADILETTGAALMEQGIASLRPEEASTTGPSKEWNKAYQTFLDAGASQEEAKQLADEDVPGG